MNAIIAVALLAVCASAQVFDQTTDLNRILLKNKYNDLTVTDLLKTNGLFDKTLFNTKVNTPWVLPRNFDNKVDTTIYTLDEIVRHPLFTKFLTLPLFRQHLTHPLFQYYLTTPLFQQYWTIPEFQTFFTNPYLFYKYVYPVVFNTQSTVFNKVNTMNTMYPIDTLLNKDVLPVDTLFNKVNTMNTMYPIDTLLNKNVLPVDTLLNKDVLTTMYPTMMNTMINRNTLPYTTVMEKLFKNYLINKVNKPTLTTEVITDVKIMDKKVNDETLNYKIVDGKIIPVVADRKIVLDDILARRPIDRTMMIEPTMIIDLLMKNPTLLNELLIKKPTLINDLLLNKPIDIMMVKELLGDKILPTTETMNMFTKPIDTMMLKELLGDKIMPTTETMNMFTKPIDTMMLKELLGDKIMPIEDMTMLTNKNMNIKDLILKKLLLNKIMYGDKKIETVFPEYTTEMKNIPILEKIEKINKINRLENIMGEDKINMIPTNMMNMIPTNKINMIPTNMNIDEMIRTPVTSDLFLRKYNKDLLTRIPMTKEMKDFTIETPMTMTDKFINTIPEFKTMNLEKPIKTIVQDILV